MSLVAPRGPRPRRWRALLIAMVVVPLLIATVSALAAAGVFGEVRRKDGKPETRSALAWNAAAFGTLGLVIALIVVLPRRKRGRE